MRIDRVLWSVRSVAHIARHEITPEEVEDVLFSPPLDARRGKREGTYLVLGRSQGGRRLLVVIALRPRNSLLRRDRSRRRQSRKEADEAMTRKYPSKDELEQLSDRYEQLSDEDVLVEWERGEPATIDVAEPMVSRSVRFSRHTMDRLHEVARARGIGVTQLIREWTEQRLQAGGDLTDRALLADELERAARLLRESA